MSSDDVAKVFTAGRTYLVNVYYATTSTLNTKVQACVTLARSATRPTAARANREAAMSLFVYFGTRKKENPG